MKFLDNFQEQIYALFRIMISFLFIWHGTQKFFNFPVEYPWPLNPMSAAAGAIEVVAGTLILIGLFTRPAAFISSGMMAVGYWMVHGMKGFFPIANGGEISVMFCFSFLLIAAHGAGIWSMDKN